jgi:UDP-N-acetylmuramate--alanine ligase
MDRSVDFNGQPFHFIGIGGIGMSGLAYILAEKQLPVSGSDLRSTNITQRLEAAGARIFPEQSALNLETFQNHAQSSVLLSKISRAIAIRPATTVPQVICSTAINDTNPEYQAALALGYPIFHRSDLLAALMQDYHSIAVAGTHGKTTTSSMVGYILLKAGLDPTIIVGGEVDAWHGNARTGKGEYLVAEADESDGSLAKLTAKIGVITNIELDHPDFYHSLDQVIDIFQTFAGRCPLVVGCIDCQQIREQIRPQISYALHRPADYTVSQVLYTAEGTQAQVWERGQLLGVLNLRVLGGHNLSNALAAIAVSRHLGIDWHTISQALQHFGGAKRRFEFRGEFKGAQLFDDYAHHPSEIRVTLTAARLRAKGMRIVAVFQPHRYSRTKAFLAEFAQAFTEADQVVITDIYSAGEQNPGDIDAHTLSRAIAEYQPQVTYQPNLDAVESFLRDFLQPNDLVIFLGAGNLNTVIPRLAD